MSWSDIHGHSYFSNLRFLDCIDSPESIIDQAYKLGLKGVAITDHEALSSFVSAEKYLAKKKKENPDDAVWQEMRFIRGNEIYLVRDGLNKDNFTRGEDKFFHFVLLAKDYTGYQQLCELSSLAWKRMYKYYQLRVSTYYSDLKEVIGKNPGHLIGSTACLGGQLASKLLDAKNGEIGLKDATSFCEAWALRMEEIFGKGNFFIELQPAITEEQIYVNRVLYDLSEKLGIKAIVTTDHHFKRPEDRKVHKAYLQSQDAEREVDAFYEATFMMTADEVKERMRKSFNDEADIIAQELMDNTNIIRNMCEDYSLLKPLELPYLPMERFDVEGINEDDPQVQDFINRIPNIKLFLGNEQCNHQFASRLFNFMIKPDKEDDLPRYLIAKKAEAMNTEVKIIWDSGVPLGVHWSKYLLQMGDYLELFWNEGDTILAPSRGSAGASYSCHALGINQIDPTRETAPLIFERLI